MECHVHRMIEREYRRECAQLFVEFKTGAMDSIVGSMRRYSEYYNSLSYIIISRCPSVLNGANHQAHGIYVLIYS
jgi:hypothetical protein